MVRKFYYSMNQGLILRCLNRRTWVYTVGVRRFNRRDDRNALNKNIAAYFDNTVMVLKIYIKIKKKKKKKAFVI